MNWLDQLLFGIRRVFSNGSELPARPAINIIGGVVVDDVANHRTNITLPEAALLSSAAGLRLPLVTTPQKTALLAATPEIVGGVVIDFSALPAWTAATLVVRLRTSAAPEANVELYDAEGITNADVPIVVAGSGTHTPSTTGARFHMDLTTPFTGPVAEGYFALRLWTNGGGAEAIVDCAEIIFT